MFIHNGGQIHKIIYYMSSFIWETKICMNIHVNGKIGEREIGNKKSPEISPNYVFHYFKNILICMLIFSIYTTR